MGEASVKDVAEAAGVSLGTVSNVLNAPHRVSESTRARVLSAIESLGYVRNDAARQLSAGRSRVVGVLIPDVTNPFFSAIARAAAARAHEQGYTLLLADSGGLPEVERAQLALFREQRVRAVLVAPGGAQDPVPHGPDVVVIDRLSTQRSTSSVSVDDVLGGQHAVEHLMGAGRRRIAVLGGTSAIRQAADRALGARWALERAGQRLRWFPSDELTVVAGRELGARIAALPARDRPDALFAVNDLVAIGVLQVLVQQRDVRVPEDVAVIGYDDIEFAAVALVPLTSVRQPVEGLGRAAVDLALRPDGEPGEQVVLPAEVVARRSTAGAGA